MSALSTYLENALWAEVFNGVNFVPPSTIYLALYTSNPTDEDVGTEVSGGSYARQTYTPTTNAQVGGKATIYNDGAIEFPAATGDWGEITHAGLRDALTGGNLLTYAPLTVAKTINSGDTLRLQDAESVFTLD